MQKEESAETYAQIFKYYIYAVVIIGLALSILIPEILQIMVTEKFRSASDLIPLVILSMIIFGTHFHFEFGILYSKKTKYLAYINILCAMMHLLFNYFLILKFGLYGAVASSIIVLSVQAALIFIISQRLYYLPYKFSRIAAFITLAIITYTCSRLIHTHLIWLNLIVKSALIMIFPLVIYNFNILSTKEKTKIRTFLRKKIFSKYRVKSLVAPN
jgi:O-antigen/teichoic acid export membrane protein